MVSTVLPTHQFCQLTPKLTHRELRYVTVTYVSQGAVLYIAQRYVDSNNFGTLEQCQVGSSKNCTGWRELLEFSK